jgi:multicopper oxidase
MRGWSLGLLGVLSSLFVAGVAWGGLSLSAFDRSAADTSAPPTGVTLYADLEIVAYSCTFYPDGVCLGYNGVTPGPSLVTHEGDVLVVNVTNHVPATVASLPVSATLKARLSAASLGLHTHGVTITAENDGVAAHAGTNLIDSSVAPNATRTYTLGTFTRGSWHYHDHILGPDGSEGASRGLFGTLLVLPAGESTTVFDLHLLNSSPNGGRGLSGSAGVGQRFDLAVAGLGDYSWNVKLFSPTNALLWEENFGPGVSNNAAVLSAESGTYTWKAKTIFLAPTYTGTVTVS